MTATTFDLFNTDAVITPVVVSVPHAGRDYHDLQSALRVPVQAVEALEDRHADLLVAKIIAAGVPTIISRMPRLAIDLNRSMADLDPAFVKGWPSTGAPLSQKARSGLGLVPSRLAGVGMLWREPIAAAVVSDRIAGHYNAYHASIHAMMYRASAAFGTAILVDVHSMPPPTGLADAEFVIGDRFGQTISDNLVETIAAVAKGHGLRVALNDPYAGGHIIVHHANPARQHHAVQIELDRKRYLDSAVRGPGPGLQAMQSLLAAITDTLGIELRGALPLAAE